MDPYATLEIWVSSEPGSDEREQAYHDLEAWIASGGFPPSNDWQAWGSFLETWYNREVA